MMCKPLSKRVSTKADNEIPPESAPDISQGKAVIGTALGLIMGGVLSVMAIAIAALVIIFALCVVWGVGIALSSF